MFLEFPDFGYGPASTMLALVSRIAERHAWQVVSAGAAAEFVGRQLPGAVCHELDTFVPSSWPGFCGIAPPGSVVVSCTNPEFAAWAIDRGYRVGIVDTLDWMWAKRPAGLNVADFHLVQAYFGGQVTPNGDRRETIRPVADPALWRPVGGGQQPGTALVSFGGMRLPGRDDLVAGYVRWLLSAALPVLVEHAGVERVRIVGGRSDLADLVPPAWSRHPALRVGIGVDRATYAGLVQRAAHLIVSPGLATIYECAAAGLTPLLQPGFNMSMVLQARDLAATGYPHVSTWPWLTEATQAVAAMAEDDGVCHVAEHVTATIHHADPGGETVASALMHYLERGDDAHGLSVPVPAALPDGADLLATHLARLT
ncbi:MAG: hypothetical protein HY241_09255 [Actinobacteria bacterium]|nr:hypothetical protein [Actinomycetota bacterium]